MDQITPPGSGGRIHLKTQLLKHTSHQVCSDQSLRDHLGSKEEPLQDQPLQIKTSATFSTDAWGGQPTAGLLHQRRAAGHIAAGGGDGASKVLDQRSGNQIGTHRWRLLLLHQFAVAVVNKHHAIRLATVDQVTQPADLLHIDRRPPAVAAAALDQHHATGLFQRP